MVSGKPLLRLGFWFAAGIVSSTAFVVIPQKQAAISLRRDAANRPSPRKWTAAAWRPSTRPTVAGRAADVSRKMALQGADEAWNVLTNVLMQLETALFNAPTMATSSIARLLLKLLDVVDWLWSLVPTVVPSFPTDLLSVSDLRNMAVEAIASMMGEAAGEVLFESVDFDKALEEWTASLGSFLQEISSSSTSSPVVMLAVVAVTSVITFTLVSTILRSLRDEDKEEADEPTEDVPYPTGRYDPYASRRYFDRRPWVVAQRLVFILSSSLPFGWNILQDYLNDKLDDPEQAEERGKELATLLTTLGPTFIKVGQSLSIRTDLIRPPYIRGLQSLQDQVPAFDTAEAMNILEEELNVDIDDVFATITDEPVAAASLGQVYRATLLQGGGDVAIKIQRPNIRSQIALDMHLVREVAAPLKRTFNLNTDLVGTVDAWGRGFVDELDYQREAQNAEAFSAAITQTPLREVVFAPPVRHDLSSARVLTTEWIDGERLDKSSQSDVTALCSIAMNAYLTMMLETGVLHCDPHPGNLLRTTDGGRLCILDWGMVTTLDPSLRYTLIEHMAHLTSADYDEIPRDLLLLGFIPPKKADLIQDSGVVEVLADIYGKWTAGGGAASVNVNDVVRSLQDLTATRGNLFQIPPYFAYIAKSFSVLEGIGLTNNPKYSIIKDCLPYVSKRLLTDTSDRAGGALRTFVFGPSKSDDNRLVDYDRVEQLVTGFSSYTTSSTGEQLSLQAELTPQDRLDRLGRAADSILDIIVSEEETPLQTILVEQVAKILTASSRTLWWSLRQQSGKIPGTDRTLLGWALDPLGLFRTSPLVQPSERDDEVVETTRKIIDLLQKQQFSILAQDEIGFFNSGENLDRETVRQLASLLVEKVWDRRRAVLATGQRLTLQILELTANVLERGERRRREREPRPEERFYQEAEAITRSESVAVAVNGAAAPPPAPTTSARLQAARQMLHQVENGAFEQEMEPQASSKEESFVARQ